jgi:acyl-ACP thioesterase
VRGGHVHNGQVLPLMPRPDVGRVYTSSRRVRLSDMDARGRLRLDAVARYLQDVATDDVAETGWGAPDHLWVVRKTRIDVVEPVAGDQRVELATWCSGTGGTAAGRRTSIAGANGGRIETDSVWIHLDHDGRPARIDPSFAVYSDAAAGRRVSGRFELAGPSGDTERRPWPLRRADEDVMAHVNNAAYWAAVEELLAGDASPRLSVALEFRRPLDVGDEVELVAARDGDALRAAFVAGGDARAVALVQTGGAGSYWM